MFLPLVCESKNHYTMLQMINTRSIMRSRFCHCTDSIWQHRTQNRTHREWDRELKIEFPFHGKGMGIKNCIPVLREGKWNFSTGREI